MQMIVIGSGLLLWLLSACAEGRWVHAERTDVQMQDDWNHCKEEVLSGREHNKDTMAGGVNLSGCMHSKGYRYLEDRPPKPTGSQQ